jgi:hypothetical protein
MSRLKDSEFGRQFSWQSYFHVFCLTEDLWGVRRTLRVCSFLAGMNGNPFGVTVSARRGSIQPRAFVSGGDSVCASLD